MYLLYIIHFGRAFHHARHYVGTTAKSLAERLQVHRSGHGSCLTRAVVRAGIDLESIHLINSYGNRNDVRTAEIFVKRRHEAAMLCPKCAPDEQKKAYLRNKFYRSKKKKEKGENINAS